MYDVIIIGKGPAGLSAALYLGREGYKILVLGETGYLGKCKELNNYLGIESISGNEFINIAKRQVTSVGVKLKKDKVLKISKLENGFSLLTDTNEYVTKTIVMALGVKKNGMKIKDVNKFIGKGVSRCVSCDGFFYKNKKVGVIGNSEYAIEEALNLRNYTEDITIYTDGREMNISEKYKQYIELFKYDYRTIESVDGDKELTHIIFYEGEKVKIDGIFIANRIPNIDDLSGSIGIITKNNKIKVDENNMTNIEGVFACGDMINNFKQVSTAVGSGAVAGHSCIKYLIMLNLNKEKKL